MKKSTIILCLSILASGAVYGQEVVGVGTVPSGGQPWNQPLPWEKFVLPPKDFKLEDSLKPSSPFQNAQPPDRVDPFMPIVVPPTDLLTKFPIKEIPHDFPSNMPVYKLEDQASLSFGLPPSEFKP